MWVTHSSSLDGWNVWGTIGDLQRDGSSIMGMIFDKKAYKRDNNKESIVYKATNLVTGDFYIGVTRQGLKRRAGQHIAMALREDVSSSLVHRMIKTYGADNFVFETIATLSTYVEAAQEEMRFIAELSPRYNLSPGGESVSNIGWRLSEESIEKMRKTKSINPCRPWLGKKRPDIAEVQRKRLTGRPDLMRHMHVKAHTRESWDKASATKRAHGPYENHNKAMALRRKAVICLTDGRTFDGAVEAAKALGTRYDNMVRHLNGKRKTLYGMKFAYLEEIES